MKLVLKKLVGLHHLTFEQLCSILAAVEATLNRQPLLLIDYSSPEGVASITSAYLLFS